MRRFVLGTGTFWSPWAPSYRIPQQASVDLKIAGLGIILSKPRFEKPMTGMYHMKDKAIIANLAFLEIIQCVGRVWSSKKLDMIILL